jgi:hypothetical protein
MVHEANPQSDGAAKTAKANTGIGGRVGVPGSGRAGIARRIGTLVSATLIPNWRQAPRFASMWCYTVIAGLCVGWLAMGAINGQPYMIGPSGIKAILVLSILGAVLRLVAQPGLAEDVRDFVQGE